MQGRQFLRRVRDLALLVEGQREVQPNARIFRPLLQRRLILDDGFGVAPCAGERGSQVGANVGRIGPQLQISPVLPDSAFGVAGLMQSDRLLQNLLRRILAEARHGSESRASAK